MDNDLLHDLTPDDLQGDLRDIAEICGMDVAVRLVEEFGGTTISVPQKRNAFKIAIQRYVVEHYNGTNATELARDLGISRSMVFKILSNANHPARRSYTRRA